MFLSGGIETTALTLTYSVYLLSKHPEQQAELLREVDAVKGQIGCEQLPSLHYTSAIINETLRLYPPFTSIRKVAAQDVQARHSSCLW